MNGYIVYHSTDNLNNVHSHGAENLIFRTLDTADRNAGQFVPLPPSGGRGQIDVDTHGIDTSDIRQDLCHNDKSFDCCCISGIVSGIISS